MKKKIICMLLVSMMVFTVVSCTKDKGNTDSNNSNSSNSSSSSSSEDNSSSNEDSSSSSSEDSSSSSEDSSSDVEISAKGLADKLLKEIDFKDELDSIDTEMALMQYNLTSEEVEEVVMYLSTGASAEEIAIFKVKGDNLRKVQSAVERRISDKKTSFKDYNPDELEKLEDPTMYVKDDYVVLCISDDDNKSRDVIDKYMSEK